MVRVTETGEIDYKNNVFVYPELTPIRGRPTTATLLTLRNEIRANAQSVRTRQARGTVGHLGMVCTPADYALIPGSTPYVAQPNPGEFIVQGANATAAQIASQTTTYMESLRYFIETNSVESTLIQQICAAVEKKYLDALRNGITRNIESSIPDILAHLFKCYGKITPTELSTLRNQVENLIIEPAEPVDTVFTEIDQLVEVSKIAGVPLTTGQITDIGFIVLNRTKLYNSALKAWNRKLTTEKTWENFKNHFREAQQELRDTDELTVDTFNRNEFANMVSETISEALREKEAECGNEENINPQLNIMIKEKNKMEQDMMELRKQVQQMKAQTAFQPNWHQQHQQNQQQPYWNNQCQQLPPWYSYNNNSNKSNNNNNNNNHGNTYQQQPTAPFQTHNGNVQQRGRNGRYCWTHGACNHWGRTCKNKANGHQDNASFQNTMGGNTNNVRK